MENRILDLFQKELGIEFVNKFIRQCDEMEKNKKAFKGDLKVDHISCIRTATKEVNSRKRNDLAYQLIRNFNKKSDLSDKEINYYILYLMAVGYGYKKDPEILILLTKFCIDLLTIANSQKKEHFIFRGMKSEDTLGEVVELSGILFSQIKKTSPDLFAKLINSLADILLDKEKSAGIKGIILLIIGFCHQILIDNKKEYRKLKKFIQLMDSFRKGKIKKTDERYEYLHGIHQNFGALEMLFLVDRRIKNIEMLEKL